MEMKTKNTTRKLALTGALCLLLSVTGGTAKAAEDQKSVDPVAMTTAHNQWRSKTGVPNLKWSDELAEAAQKWAEHLTENGCHPGHSGGKYGENVYLAGPATNSNGSTKMQNITEQNVVDSWGSEIKDYDYEDNTCHFVCGHYTQVIWQTTTDVGCGMATCGDKSQIWVCQYTPAGNMVGQKPYSLKTEEPSPALAATETIRDTSIEKNNSSVDQKAMITAHNTWRSKAGVPNLTWSDELARSSQKWVDHLANTSCTQGHSGVNYGENIYQAGPATGSDGSSRMQNITAQDVVDAWGNEVNDYDYSDNSCHNVCGHYTQVVWKTTTKVGCAMAVCGDKTQLWACQYSPAGNMVGEKPY